MDKSAENNHSISLKIISRDPYMPDPNIGFLSRDKMLKELHNSANEFIFQSLRTKDYSPTDKEIDEVRSGIRKTIKLGYDTEMNDSEIDYAILVSELSTIPNAGGYAQDREKLSSALADVKKDLVRKNQNAPISNLMGVRVGSTNKNLDTIEREVLKILDYKSMEDLKKSDRWTLGKPAIYRLSGKWI